MAKSKDQLTLFVGQVGGHLNLLGEWLRTESLTKCCAHPLKPPRLSKDLDHGLSRRVIDQALEYAEHRRATADPTRCVVVHGDPRAGNALRVRSARTGAESGFVFVDPDAFTSEPEYDLGVVLRDWSGELLGGDALVAHRYCALLASESGFDEVAIWECGFVERVSTGLYLLSFGAAELARPFLETAELLVKNWDAPWVS